MIFIARKLRLGLDDRTDRHAGLVSTTGNDGYQNLRNSTRTVNYLAASVAQSDDHRATVRSCVSSDRQIMLDVSTLYMRSQR